MTKQIVRNVTKLFGCSNPLSSQLIFLEMTWMPRGCSRSDMCSSDMCNSVIIIIRGRCSCVSSCGPFYCIQGVSFNYECSLSNQRKVASRKWASKDSHSVSCLWSIFDLQKTKNTVNIYGEIKDTS